MDPKEIREAFNASGQRMATAASALAGLADDAPAETVDAADAEFRAAKEAHEAAKADLATLEAREKREKEITEAREFSPVVIPDTPARPRDPRNVEQVYRPDEARSFFADQLRAKQGDSAARERLERNQKHVLDVLSQKENRDLTSASTAGGDFLPPIYLADMYVNTARGGRPFADAVQQAPLPDLGLSITLPSLDGGGVSVAEQVDTGSVSETDAVSSTVSHSVYFIAGQQDLWRGILERSQPGLDMIIMADLVAAYDELLDTRLLAGSGTAQHTGIRQVSGVNTVSYTDGSPTAAELLPKLYDAIQKINSAKRGPADTLVIHPRRSSWLASNLSSTFPIFQQGGFNRGVGAQDRGQTIDPLGLKQVIDPNIGTTYGASTNEDEIYVLASRHLFLMEGALRTRVFEEVGSGTAAIRLQAFAYSAFISKRVPKAISVISGTGLVTPTF